MSTPVKVAFFEFIPTILFVTPLILKLMQKVKHFLLFCAGVDRSLLAKAPTDEHKYIGIGATVLFTGLLAFFSGGYAMYTVFDNAFLAIVFGLIWGLMIFNLDRYIVLSMKSNGAWFKDFMVAFPRLILAVFLALVISKPLELKIFEKEINAELVQMEQEVYKKQEDQVRVRYAVQVADYQSNIQQLKTEIAQKTANRDSLERMAIQEADGTGGSRKRNLGPIYKTKKAAAENAQKELDGLMASYLPIIKEQETSIQNINSDINKEITNLKRSAYGGLAARMDALDRLASQSEAIFWANLFIILLFVSIETAPIFVKLIASRSPYDFVLHEVEHEFKMANLEKTSLLSNAIKNKIQFDTEVGVYQNNARIQMEKELIDAQLTKKLEELKGQEFDWA